MKRQSHHRICIPTLPSATKTIVANNADNITVMATSSMTMKTLLVSMHTWLGLWLRGSAPLVKLNHSHLAAVVLRWR